LLNLLTPTRLHLWTERNVDDAALLDTWRQEPLTFQPEMAKNGAWHVDLHERTIARQADEERFQQARDLLLRYRFYPPHILTHVGDYDGEERLIQVGDRVVQRFHLAGLALGLPGLFDRSFVDVVAMNEIVAVVDEPRRCGFTYVTTARHREVGAWTATVTWTAAADLRLNIRSISRPAPDEPRRNHRLMRWLQLKAHRLGMGHFERLVAA
jgi:uncharacterized protein (UPF0548 family)